ncbi:hypothetical protein VD0002_g8876 [Verticillium dahliae]|uniref:Uncharacterized protein n=3 Tax=Verticillium TaxID=1036719 RepID=G2XGU4_VERDV|nr:uncharacterized protein VDAG_09376 [Verticillium dahliae VdLs.17]KAF3358824.1 hypothetical protein VdG1_02736 [Verticillium dahliae VDG1]KAH6693057.1 hypothetical protein EV126DRAFT_402769 [Verticillium dahliae]EGY19042.1 hypothetical protein VDAG_09376 [Verticillium dahliae VdLs.17]PNH27310.1 hypothetical protein BJF96_g9355 [Verticillium dahliae]PNH58657.1 hypothetical protein VD0002_g8876 [Verticillium dahliae]
MYTMRLLLARLLLALCLTHAVSAGRLLTNTADAVLIARQDAAPAGGNPLAQPQCLEYSRTANFSTIGSNITLRSAFIQASPFGTHQNLDFLAAMVVALPPMTADTALNAACGNLTTVAAAEAARNFSEGNIAGFPTSLTADATVADWQVIFCMFAIVVFMGIPWLFMLG